MKRIIVAITTVSMIVLSGVLSGDARCPSPAGGELSHAATGTIPLSRIHTRLEALNRGAALLDAGAIDEAASLFEMLLRSNPALVEGADGLIEVRTRECAVDRALELIQSSGAGMEDDAGARVVDLYLRASRFRRDRDFGEAAAAFHEAADAAEALGDSLSVLICLMRSARCRIDARDGNSALESLRPRPFFSCSCRWSGAGPV